MVEGIVARVDGIVVAFRGDQGLDGGEQFQGLVGVGGGEPGEGLRHICRLGVGALAAVEARQVAQRRLVVGRAGQDALKPLNGTHGIIEVVGLHLAQPDLAIYMTAKAGIEGLTRGLARDLGGFGIRVNCIVPGAVRTPRQMALWQSPESEAKLLGEQCLHERVEPEHVRDALTDVPPRVLLRTYAQMPQTAWDDDFAAVAPETIALLESLGAKNNHKCRSC